MIKNADLLEQWGRELFRKERLSFKENLELFEGMWKEANTLHILPSRDPLEGIESKINIAKILNSLS
ncbi:MAG: hypothetical protein J7J51_04410 [Candidatus Omnitrophica bacterium]|nr:hypothetical protein [Candidatus Omnitrophota bacterium]